MLSFSLILLLAGSAIYGMPTDKIVNGTDAQPGEFPYIVSLELFGSHSCGGSIINEIYVQTAAHCVAGYSESYMTIQYGTVDITEKKNVVQVKKITVHEGYAPQNGWLNDVAVLELAEPITFDGNARPVILPKQSEDFQDWSNATLIGWGYPYTGGQVLNHLQKVAINLFPKENCESAHGSMFNRICHVCAGVVEGGKGQCSGDSGGPLTINGVLVGSVSWSVKPCTIVGYPGVFARISNYVDWINTHTKLSI